MNQIEFITACNEKHSNKYDYSLVNYVNTIKPIIVICPIHSEFKIRPFDHLRGYKCPQCGIIDRRNKTIERNKSSTNTLESFVDRANIKYKNQFIYNKAIYTGVRNKLIITCKIHGDFEQTPGHHLGKNGGCNKCKFEDSKQEFIKKSIDKFSNQFTYEKLDYSNKDKITLNCKDHGYFNTPSLHHLKTSSGGCVECTIKNRKQLFGSINLVTPAEFFNKCSIIHNNKYDYTNSIYVNGATKVNIICPKHGMFSQVAGYHKSGNGCQKCANEGKSKMEGIWLDSYKIPDDYRNYRLKLGDKLIIVDGIDLATNTIYEFWGDYWHGNPLKYKAEDVNKSNKQTFGYLYQATLDKISLIRQNGYNLVEIWEKDWNEIYNGRPNKVS